MSAQGCSHFCMCLSACQAALHSLTSHPMTPSRHWETLASTTSSQGQPDHIFQTWIKISFLTKKERHLFCVFILCLPFQGNTQLLNSSQSVSVGCGELHSPFSVGLSGQFAYFFLFFFHLHMIIILGPHSYCRLNDTEIRNVVSDGCQAGNP